MPMEKQNTVENQLAHTITQTEFDSDYDKTAKKLLANKQILAQIMKGCVDEYSECSVDEIAEKYIEGTPEVGTVGVHVDDTNRPPKAPDVITGSNNEDSTLTEGTVRYDVRFDAIAPTAANDAAQQDVIRLIINVEAQTAFNPGYPLTKRAIYYCSRMISAQHGPIFKKSEYGKIRKVYSIWVCTKPSDEFQNTLTRYSIRPEQLIGNAAEKSENYVNLAFDKEALYKNMVDAKADWLYNLPQWDKIFTEEKKKALYMEQKKSGTVVKPHKVGRNDPCPCGSGKKYKYCCGR